MTNPIVNLSPFAGAGAQFFDNNGVPLSAGTITTYASGSTTQQATYTTPLANVQNSNPIVLNSSGRTTQEIWLLNGYSYKFVLADVNGNTIGTYDNIPSTTTNLPIVNDASSISYEEGYTVTAGSFVVGETYLITTLGTTNFTLIGATTNTVGTFFTATGVGTGTGTAQLSRTVQSKLQEQVSVQDFGAISGNSSSNIQTQNYNAFVSAFTASNNVFIPAGTYYLTGSTITIPDNSIVTGAGPYATIINFTQTSDCDCFQIGWYTTLQNMQINSGYSTTGNYGTLRLQSLTNSNIPTNVGGNNWRNPSIGGLSYRNTLRNLVLQNGQNYNIYMVNVAYTSIENVRAVLSKNTAGNLVIYGKGGTNLPSSTTVFMAGSNEFTSSYAGPGVAISNTTNSYFQFISEGNYGRGLTVTGNCANLEFNTCYLENNFALGASTGDYDVVVAANTTNCSFINCLINQVNSNGSLSVSNGYTHTGYSLIAGVTYTTNPPIAPAGAWNVYNGESTNGLSDLLTNNTSDYNAPYLRNQNRLFPTQTAYSSPYSLTLNSIFSNWTGSLPASWTYISGTNIPTQNTSELYYRSGYSVQFATYPSTLVQYNLQNQMEWLSKNYTLVLVGKAGNTISSSSSGYDGSHRTYVLISETSTNYFINIPQTSFPSSTDWTVVEYDLAAIFGNSIPAKNLITAMSVVVCCTAGTVIGHIGIYNSDAPYILPN